MSRKNSRSDSIEIFINRRRTSSSSSSNGNDEYKRSNSIDSRSMSIGSIESITMEEIDNNGRKTDKIAINTDKKIHQISIHKEITRRARDVYYEVDFQPSPNPLYLTHLTRIPWKDTSSNTKK